MAGKPKENRGLKFRELYGYQGKFTLEAMGREMWNNYCNFIAHQRSAENANKRKTELEERRMKIMEEHRNILAKRHKDGAQFIKYCDNIKDVENFINAQKDDFAGWILHHRKEIDYTSKELKERGEYYKVSASDLIFMRLIDHNGNPKIHKGLKERKGWKRKEIKSKHSSTFIMNKIKTLEEQLLYWKDELQKRTLADEGQSKEKDYERD